MNYTLHLGDCLDVMRGMEPQSVDAIITDLPYGTTACKWDEVIPFAPMWEVVKRVLKPRGAFVTTASQPFTSALVMSNPKWFRHRWVWEKSKAASFATCNVRPLTVDEDILVFGGDGVCYLPQMEPYERPYTRSFVGNVIKNTRHETSPFASEIPDEVTYTHRYPRSVIRFSNVFRGKEHPTQKPVDLMEYLIRTYTNPGDTVLDMTMGSGTTGVAAMQTGRRFIGIELDAGYYAIAEKRIANVTVQPELVAA